MKKLLIKHNAILIYDDETNKMKHKIFQKKKISEILEYIKNEMSDVIVVEKPHDYAYNICYGIILASFQNIIILHQNEVRKILFKTDKLSTDMLMSEVRVRIGVEYANKNMLNLADCLIMLLYINTLKEEDILKKIRKNVDEI